MFSSCLIIICTAIVMTTVVTVTSLGTSSKLTLLENLRSELGLDLIYLTQAETAKKGFYFTNDDMRLTKAIDNIDFYLPGFGVFFDVFDFQNIRIELVVLRTNENFKKLIRFRASSGSFFTKKDVDISAPVCLISLKAANEYKKLSNIDSIEDMIGDNITFMPRDTSKTPLSLKIVGIYDSVPGILEDNLIKRPSIIIPTKFMEEKAGVKYGMSGFYVAVKDIRMIDKTIHDLNILFQNRGKEIKAYSEKKKLEKYFGQLNSLYKIGFLYSAITITGATISIVSIFLIMLISRYREIGIRRVTGASKKAIFMQFYTEFMILILFRCVLGIILTKIIIWLIFTYYLEDMVFIYSNESFYICVFITWLFLSTVGLFPVHLAVRKDIADLLR